MPCLEGRGEGRGEPGPVARRPKDQKGRVTKTSVMHRKEPLREGMGAIPCDREGLRDTGRTRQPGPL